MNEIDFFLLLETFLSINLQYFINTISKINMYHRQIFFKLFLTIRLTAFEDQTTAPEKTNETMLELDTSLYSVFRRC